MNNLSKIEAMVQASYDSIEPNPEFANRLRTELAARSAVLSHQNHRPHSRPQARQRWKLWPGTLSRRFAVLAILLVLVVTAVLAIGPQKIVAYAQSLLGFVPGMGFVEEETAYHLCEPAQTRYQRILLKVDSAGGSGRKLQINGSMEGFGDQAYNLKFVDEFDQEAKVTGGGGGGTYDFMGFDYELTLPSDSRNLTVIMAPEDTSLPPEATLRLPIQLCPGSQPGGPTAAAPGENTPGSYHPASEPAVVKGISVQVQQVYHSNQVTGLEVQLSKDENDPENQGLQGDFTPWVEIFMGMQEENVTLTDDTGHVYRTHPVMSEVLVDPNGIKIYESEPLQPDARQLTLRFQSIALDFTETGSFRFDPGPQPAYDQTWDLAGLPDAQQTLNGFEISFLSARYFVGQVKWERMGQQAGAFLEIEALIRPPSGRYASACPMVTSEYGNLQCVRQAGENRYNLYLDLTTHPLDGPLALTIGPISARVAGPWEITWDIPAEYRGAITPQVDDFQMLPETDPFAETSGYIPSGAEVSGLGVTVGVPQARHDADQTAVQLAVTKDLAAPESQGEQSGFIPALYFYIDDPNEFLVLTDDTGKVYYPTTSYTEADENGLTPLTFEPLQPGARQLNLRVEKLTARFEEKPAFTFDPGSDPQPGQEWDLRNQPGTQFTINGYQVSILSARYFVGEAEIDADGNRMPGLFIEWIAEVSAEESRFVEPKLDLLVDGNGYAFSVPLGNGQFRLVCMLDDVLKGTIQGELQLEAMLIGPWDLTWEVPDH